jgi:mono/diheme cytochrome c family protein
MSARAQLLLWAVVASLGLAGCKVRPPGALETRVVDWGKHNVTIGGSNARNPVAATSANIEAGKNVFGYYCVVCHGRDGQNTGVPFSANMSPPVPPLTSSDVQHYTDGQLKWIIENGIEPSGMPASKGILGDDDIWHIVVYLRHLPPAGSLGDPKAYSGDEYGKSADLGER